MNIFDKMVALDRRWVFLFLFVVVALAYFLRNHFTVDIVTTREVRSIYNFVENLEPGDKLLISFDYDPSSLAELHPMSRAIITQCYKRKVKVIGVTLSQYGAGMVEEIFREIGDVAEQEYGREIVYGEDYCFIGYRPYPAFVILGMGENFRVFFPRDYYDTPLDDLPIMKGVKNYDDVKAVLAITSGTTADFWVIYGNARYNMPLALGVTGVMATDYYPYLGNALFGLIGGWKGAAEYEKLVGRPDKATAGMPAQVAAHLTIVLFIVIGNIGYLLSRKTKKKLG
ncbi:MAG: hypothetical protein KKG33_05850 [candidate division Zixibacteria bacterium]|nr:hypothetical protein [candidate division Zixibacteria bacterium]MBU1471030.1 hypothetical protein [candidate division Zixibacteria bacterium]MBU2625065.1 hypothetical protein [candidate division Zixibacteria bacterium]